MKKKRYNNGLGIVGSGLNALGTFGSIYSSAAGDEKSLRQSQMLGLAGDFIGNMKIPNKKKKHDSSKPLNTSKYKTFVNPDDPVKKPITSNMGNKQPLLNTNLRGVSSFSRPSYSIPKYKKGRKC